MDFRIHDGFLDSRWILGFTTDSWIHDVFVGSVMGAWIHDAFLDSQWIIINHHKSSLSIMNHDESSRVVINAPES